MEKRADSAESANVFVSRIQFRNAAEYAALIHVRREAFTPWYENVRAVQFATLARLRLNALAECFPELFFEARGDSGVLMGWLFCLPAEWNGDVEDLGSFDRIVKGRIGRLAGWSLTTAYGIAKVLPIAAPIFRVLGRRIRRGWMGSSNAVVLGAMLVLQEFRGSHIPALLLQAVARQARAAEFKRIIGPFRPSAYGEHKAAKRAGFSEADFAAYCAAHREDNLPVDPWLRALARNGARALRPEARSFTVTKPLRIFEAFRRTYRPNCWYEASPGQWECGETQSWFVKGDSVTSVEPNLWCEVPMQ